MNVCQRLAWRISLAVFAVGIGLVPLSAEAQNCGPVPTTVNGNATPLAAASGKLSLGKNSTISNGTSSVAAAGSGTSANTTSGLQPTGQSLPGFLPSSFPASSTGSLNINGGSLGPGVYGDVTVSSSSTSTFSGGTYVMSKLTAGNNVTLNVAAGDYFINTFSAGQNFRLNVTSGPVRIFINTSFQTGNQSRLNSGGNAENLQIYLYDGAQFQLGNNITSGVTLSGLIYAPGSSTQINLGNNNVIQGAILSGGQVSLGSNTRIMFDPTTQNAIGSINTCGLMGDWRMDENTPWKGSTGEIKDSSGNGYHGTAKGGASTASGSPAYSSNGQSTCGYGWFDRNGTLRTYAELPSGPLKMTSSFTVSAWIRSTDATAQHQRIFVNDDNGDGWGLSLADGTGTAILRLFNRKVSFSNASGGGTINSGNVALDTPAVITSNAWYFVAATIDTAANKATLYVYNASGTQLANTTADFSGAWCPSTACTGASAIGGETSASAEGQQDSWHFLGNIDEVRLFRTALPRRDIESALTRVRTCANGGPDHIRVFLNNDTSALTCQPRNIETIACADPACASRFTSVVSVTLAPNGATASIAAGSSGFPSVASTSPGSQNITLANASPSTAGSPNFRCFTGSPSARGDEITGNCSVTFATAGFIVSVPNHTSCTRQTLTIKAVKANTAQQCVSAFSDGVARDINLRFSYTDPNPSTSPATAAHAPRVGAAVADGDPAKGAALQTAADTTLSMLFNGGQATTNFLYDDVGSLTVKASYTGSSATGDSGLSMTGTMSPPVIVAPASFSLAVPPAPLTAGTPFNTTVAAKNACLSPATTPNFGKEDGTATVKLTSTNPQPGPGNATSISDSLIAGGSSSPFAGGGTASKALTWDEVGTVDIVASLASYQGWTLPSPAKGKTTAERFKPHHFETVATHACSNGFTYSGQPFTVKTSAYKQGGSGAAGITANYADSAWANSVVLTPWSGSPLTVVAAATGNIINGTYAATNFVNGTATANNVQFVFSNPQTPPLTITLRATETSGTDNVTSDGAPEGSTPIRSGRLWMGNAYGSELLPLPVPMQLQFWSASGWSRNALDTCTALVTPDSSNGGLVFAAVSPSNKLSAGKTTASLTNPAISGDPKFRLSAPGAGFYGLVDIVGTTLRGTSTWLALPTPTARACFGICGPRNPVIYQRENY